LINLKSVRARFAISMGSNAVRALMGFATGLLIARLLNPTGYGNLMFLLGSFAAIRTLLDMGSSSAFFTLASQRARGIHFYLIYFFWLAFQFSLTLVVLGLLLPFNILEKVWLGHDRDLVILAFLASFMQQQAWQTVVQIGESMRETLKTQAMSLSISVTYFLIIIVIGKFTNITIQMVLLIIITQYFIGSILAGRLLIIKLNLSSSEVEPLKKIIHEYLKYCKPLFVMSFVGFIYDFTDKWMLQHYAGATEQGYFQVASQFSAVSLLATASILHVFWKEIAEAWNENDTVRVGKIYKKVNRGLVMLGACVSGLFMPWSEQIIQIILGSTYVHAWPVLSIMLLYPIHQSMGQIGGAMLLACGQTRRYTLLSVFTMLFSIPISYVLLAPATSSWVSGYQLGSLGLATKMVILGIVSVNIQAWMIAWYGGWKYDWTFQIIGIPLFIGLGFISKFVVGLYWTLDNQSANAIIIPVLIMFVVYSAMIFSMVFAFPWLIGVKREFIIKIFHVLVAKKTAGSI
jgi:O-antigen/teichoic acid export membrane protein